MPATTKTQVIQETVLLLHQRFPVQKDPLLQMAVWEAQLHSWCRNIDEASAEDTLICIAQILRLLLVKKIPTRQIEVEKNWRVKQRLQLVCLVRIYEDFNMFQLVCEQKLSLTSLLFVDSSSSLFPRAISKSLTFVQQNPQRARSRLYCRRKIILKAMKSLAIKLQLIAIVSSYGLGSISQATIKIRPIM